MLEFYSKIKRVLLLEKEKGFQNSAVGGGLGRFIGYIQKQGGIDGISDAIIQPLIEAFENYSSLTVHDRSRSIESLLFWISETSNSNPIQDNSAVGQEPINSTSTAYSQDPALYADIRSIKGIGSKNYKYFNKLGIDTIYDLLHFFPRRYQDFSQLKTISSIKVGEQITVVGNITGRISTRKSKRGNLKISEAILTDSTGSLRLTWFNQPFIENQLSSGSSVVVSGKVDSYQGHKVINSPVWEPMDREQIHTNRIVPIYPSTAGISQRQFRNIIKNNLDFWSKKIKEFLPLQIIETETFPSIDSAVSQIHFPDSLEMLAHAERRFAFEEIFFLQIGVLLQKIHWETKKAKKFLLPDTIVNKRIKILPYALTNAQLNAIEDIKNDLNSGKPMNRLLQGDVGSGKTVVSKFAVEMIVDNGSQTAVMAPTSILAEQHFNTLAGLLEDSGSINPDGIALLLGQTSPKEKDQIRHDLKHGKIKCIVGTHALLEDPIEFFDLQLAVIDEQHRFGVNQRNILNRKGKNPHLLVMSATPIPRSLALTIYGDLDVSTIDEMPPGRKPVETILLRPNERETAYTLIRKQIAKGFQAFIVYPLIEAEDEEDAYKSAVLEHRRLQTKVFPNIEVGLLHGRMKPQDKDEVMMAFRNHEYDILVSTTVIEVGVDIPDATIVLIESANFYGLAQLHQIRGRVGRNAEDSMCVLIPENENALENERLAAMIRYTDGFKLADIDLEFRGPGEFLGTRQSGYAGFRYAKLSDIRLIEKSRKHAQYIINSDPGLNQPDYQLLREELHNYWPEISDIKHSRQREK